MHCVDLGESFPTNIYLQNLASIQPSLPPPPPPRTSPVKFPSSSCIDTLGHGLRRQRRDRPTDGDAHVFGRAGHEPRRHGRRGERPLARPSGAACAKKGASGRMQRPTELVPIPECGVKASEGFGRLRKAPESCCILENSRKNWSKFSQKSASGKLCEI